MADLSKTVEIIFGAKDNVTVTVKNLESNLRDFDQTVQSVAAPLADVSSKILAMETAVLALSAAFVGSAISAAGQFNDSVREIGTLFQGTTEQVNQFGSDIQAYAANSTQSIESINGAVYEAISSGVAYGDSLEFVRQAEQLAVAGRADLGQVTDVLTGTLNAYGESTDKAADYTDDLLTAVNIGKTTVPELAQSLSQATSIAANADVPFSDLSAAIAAVTAAGVPTAQAMTQIRGVIEAFISPSQQAANAASELGISLNTTTLRSEGLDGALRAIFNATGGTTEGLSRIFTTTESLQGALVLGADKAGVFANALQQMASNTGLTSQAYQTMSQNFEIATQRMVNAADVALIRAGQPLLDEFGGVANGIAAVFQSLGSSIDSGAFDPIINALEAFGVSASNTLANIAQNLPDALDALDFGPLLASLGNLGDSVGEAFSDIFGNIDLDTPEGLASALQTIVNGIAGLTNVTAGIVDGLSPIFAAFGGLAESGSKAGEDAQYALGQWLGTAQVLVEFGTRLGTALIALDEFGANFTAIFDILTGTVRGIFNALEIAVEEVAVLVLGTVYNILEALGKLPDALGGERFREAAESVKATFNDWSLAVSNDIDDLNGAADQLSRGIHGVGSSAQDAAAGTDALGESVGAAAEQGEVFTGIDWSQSATGIDYVAEAARRLGISLDESGPAADQFSKYVKTAADEADIARAKTNGYRLEIDELGNRTYTPVVEGAKKTAEEVNKAGKEMEEAAKRAVEYDLKLQEIASAERIAYIEAQFKLDEAQIEADTQRLVAAFDSINTAITSTGDTLSSLIGTWAGLDSAYEQTRLWNLIEAEEDRREQAFQQQKILLDEQIRYLQARTSAMLKGDTLLRVEAAGLTPHLERIFHEILRACQVKANEQGLELLLGAA